MAELPIVGPLIAVACIAIAARSLLKKHYPQAILLVAGLLMLAIAGGLGYPLPKLDEPTGSRFFDLFRYVSESFVDVLSGVGLIMMAVAGFVAYMEKIGATDALVLLATKPLRWFQRFPYATTSGLIIVGQVLFICTPSAAGLTLLLMASVFPLMVRLGVSRLSATSAIVASTSFGMGPASSMSVRASEIMHVSVVEFFFHHQIPVAIPASLAMAVAFFVVNRHFDKKHGLSGAEGDTAIEERSATSDAPIYYAVFPILPLALLLVFSGIVPISAEPIVLDTATAMFLSMAIAAVVHALRHRNLKQAFDSLKVLWDGMATMFSGVVTLVIAADIFSKGLIGLGLIRALVGIANNIGFGAIAIGVLMTVMIYFATILMGSGNASFFAFGPLVPNIAEGLHAPIVSMLLPMEFAANMGRSASPISGVVIAAAKVGQVEPLDVARRSAIPLGVAVVVMTIAHYILQ